MMEVLSRQNTSVSDVEDRSGLITLSDVYMCNTIFLALLHH